MIDYVSETLKRWRQTPFAWNGEDCLMSLADYLKPIMGYDFGEPFRGRYQTEREAHGLIEAAGGVEAVFDRTGLTRVDVPERGDLLLIGFGSTGRATGGVCTHGRAYPPVPGGAAVRPSALPRGVFYGAARRPRGVAEIDLAYVRVLGIWSVPKCLPLSR